MSSKLAVYQEALEHLGLRPLSDISENVEPRRACDAAWDTTLRFCLEQGFWKWAIRGVIMIAEEGIDTTFGYSTAYLKPDDWLRTYVISENENFEPALMRYSDENGYWFADADPIYVKYVSDDAAFGTNLTVWPETFAAYVAVRLARRICKRLTNSEDLFQRLFKQEKMAKADAMSKDAINGGPARPPVGTWASSRGNSSSTSRWDGRFS